jgi:hypothetical protein
MGLRHDLLPGTPALRSHHGLITTSKAAFLTELEFLAEVMQSELSAQIPPFLSSSFAGSQLFWKHHA